MLPQKRKVADFQEPAVADSVAPHWQSRKQRGQAKEQAQQTLGTHKTKGQASHSHTMWGPPDAGQPKWGAEPPAVSSTDKIQLENRDPPTPVNPDWQRNSFS